MNVFEAARGVSAVDAAQKLGIPMRRTGKRAVARCVFHEDRTPSMVLYPQDGGFHCFGCGAHGDAIALYGHMHRVQPLEAARMVCADFGLYWSDAYRRPPRRPDPGALREKLLAFRERHAAALDARRQEAQLRMNRREEAMARDALPFDEWWDDAEWASAREEEIRAGEELAQLMDMDMQELWDMYLQRREENNGKHK